MYFFTYHYLYHDLLVQVISGQMVCTHIGNFVLDVSEGSGAHHGAVPTGPPGTAPLSSPPPPQPPSHMSIEQLLATQNELMRVLMENLVHRGGHQPHHQHVLDSS
jgi:hypothetical protein